MGKLSRFLLALQLCVAPFLLGSNRAVFWSLNALLAAMALLAFVLAEYKNAKRSRADWALPFQILLLLALPGLWMVFQLVPEVPQLLAHPVWAHVPGSSPAITLNPHQTALALMWWLTLGIIFVAIRAATRRDGVIWYLHLMMIVILCVAVFGLTTLYLGLETLGITAKQQYSGWLTGPFVNRNTAASFLMIGLTIAVVLGLDAYYTLQDNLRGASAAARLFLVLCSKVSVYAGVAVVIFVASLLTGSRAGLASSLLSLLVVFLLCTHKGKRRMSKVWLVTIIASLGLMAVTSNALLKRSEDGAASSNVRLELYHEAVRAIAARPMLGHGGGTYQTVEPLYRQPESGTKYIWNHAHNSYLEAAATMGLPVIIVWLALFAVVLARLFQAQRVSEKLPKATVVVLAISLSEGLHALVDFSLQIQAIALYATCLLGLSVGEIMSSQKNTQYSIA